MKTLNSIILLLILMLSTTSANVMPLSTIDNTKKVIQIGMFVENLNLIDAVQRYKNKYDLFTKSYNNYKIVYAVNIGEHNTPSILNEIKKHYKDAFVNHKIHFRNSMVTKPQDVMPMNKAKQGRVHIIQIGMFEKKQNLFNTIKKYGDTNTMMIKPYENTKIAYLMNSNSMKNKKELTIVQKTYDDAFINKKIHLYTKAQKATSKKQKVVKPKVTIKEKTIIKYIEKPKIVEKIVIKYIEKPKVVEKVIIVHKTKKMKSKPTVNMDLLISSFENLPFAIYGR